MRCTALSFPCLTVLSLPYLIRQSVVLDYRVKPENDKVVTPDNDIVYNPRMTDYLYQFEPIGEPSRTINSRYFCARRFDFFAAKPQ